MTPTRVEMKRTTARLRLMNRLVMPSSRCRRLSRLSICACTETSSAEVGSSQTRNESSPPSPPPIQNPLPPPPKKSSRKVVGNLAHTRGRQAHPLQQFDHAQIAPGRAAQALKADRLGDGRADPPARIERGIRVLENHLHPVRALRTLRIERDGTRRRTVQS